MRRCRISVSPESDYLDHPLDMIKVMMVSTRAVSWPNVTFRGASDKENERPDGLDI
jgi:hypothetical protein